MGNKANLSDLIEVITAQTGHSTQVVETFVTQLFREIEKRLVLTSSVKVDGIGLFRVIKSTEGYRILYLPNFKQSEKHSFIIKDLGKDIESLEKKKLEIEAEENESLSKKLDPLNISFEEIQQKKEPESHLSNSEQPAFSEAATNLGDDFSSEEISEADAFMLSEEKFKAEYKRRFNLRVICAATIILVIGLGAGYLYSSFEKSSQIQDKLNNILYSSPTEYQELNNPDTILYTSIVIPQRDVKIQSISKKYYGTENFWPYIYKANEDFVGDAMNIPAGTIIRIPKIESAEINDPEWISHARDLGQKILENINSN